MNLYKTLIHKISNKKIPKILWLYWAQGWEHAPPLVLQCEKSWEYYNPNWEIRILDDSNINKYFNMERWLPSYSTKNIQIAARSDILRVNLIKLYGGVWADATLWCHQPLDTWLYQYSYKGFFAFHAPKEGRPISSWFLAGRNDNYIIKKWEEKVLKFWVQHTPNENFDGRGYEYYWFHFAFLDLYLNNNNFQQIWDSIPKIGVGNYKINHHPHYFVREGYDTINDAYVNMLDAKIVPVFKLTHKKNIYNSKKIQFLFKTLRK